MAKAFNPAYPALRPGAVAIVSNYGYMDTVYPDRVVTRHLESGDVFDAMEPHATPAREAVGPHHNP